MFIFEKKNTLKLHISIFRGKIAGKDTSFGLIYGQTGNKFWVEKSGRRTENNPFPINHSILLPLFGRRLTFVPPSISSDHPFALNASLAKVTPWFQT